MRVRRREELVDGGGVVLPRLCSRLPAEVRRAGSAQTASTPVRSTSKASALTTRASEQLAKIHASDRGGDWILLDGEHPQTQTGEGDRVGADATAEVGNVGGAGTGEPMGVPRCDGQPGGLFKALRGEEHVIGPLAELGASLRPESGLRQGC